MSTENVTAMILAAGLGTRLRPLTDRIPKPLVEVAGRPLIDHALKTVRRAGISRVVVNVHHFADAVRGYLGDGSRFGCEILYSAETTLLDTGGGILQARPLLDGGTFVTLNSDTIMDIDLTDALEFHRRRGALATLVLREAADAEAFGIIRTEPDGRVANFLAHRRPGTDGPTRALMYTGVQVLEPRVFDYMTEPGAFPITRQTYPKMLAADEPLYGFEFSGKWLTVGTPDEMARAEELLGSKPDDTGVFGEQPPGHYK